VSSDIAIALDGERPRTGHGRRRLASGGGFDPDNHYLRFALVSLLIVWFIVLIAQRMLANDFVSKATLIVPGGSPSVSVSLDSIGQSSSAPASAYNTMHLSPKVIYREMAQSEAVRADAARALGVTPEEFGTPRIKLVDETSLIHIEFRALDPEAARRRAAALIDALQRQLDRLRQDELDRRAATVNANLQVYQDAVAAARARIAAVQAESGLVSTSQFNEISSSLVTRTRRVAELKADVDRLETEQTVLTERLQVAAADAALALKLTADPAAAKLLADYADITTQLKTERRRLGPEAPALIQLKKRWETVEAQLSDTVLRAGAGRQPNLEAIVNIANNSHQADLFKRLVGNEAALHGKRAEFATTTQETATLERDLNRLASAAARLEDHRKDLLVAEAVLTTAMARLNTSKSDIFGSYPLLQVLSAPSLPTRVASNVPLLAFAGGLAGTLLVSLGWFLAWLRHGYVRRRLKSA
jgi:uncharacterized protein involved in exopolysaccharide biosynthesis